MASVHSLGLHEPIALPYLISESLLPSEPSDKEYAWHTYDTSSAARGVEEEEITTTKDCVVWSRGGAVRRAFKLDIEDEPITQAFLARFAIDLRGSKSPGKVAYTQIGKNQLPEEAFHKGTKRNRKAEKHRGLHAHFIEDKDEKQEKTPKLASQQHLEQALVVILKTQAHIYFIAGDNFVVSLPFEVQNAFPASEGFILQRKLSEVDSARPQPSVPHSSFVSAQASWGLQSSQTVTFGSGQGARPPLTISTVPEPKWPIPIRKRSNSPRLYSLTDPQAQIGLVVATHQNRYEQGLHALEAGEELLYLSPKSELEDSCAGEELFLAVTLNIRSNMYTVWKVKYRKTENRFTTSKKDGMDFSGLRSRRRSSNIFGMGTGANTPGGNAPENVRESFGTVADSVSQVPASAHGPPKSSQEETLASHLGPEFGEVGVQTRAARRVSSMLARTELGAGHDRSTFHELANGAPLRTSINRTARKGESFGSLGDRASFGTRRRSSLPGNGSILSTGSSFLDAPVDHLLQELNSSGDFEGFDQMGIQDNVAELPQEVLFSKVETFPRTATPHFGETSLDGEVSVFALPWPTSMLTAANGPPQRLSLCIHNSKACELIVLELSIKKHKEADPSPPVNAKRDVSQSRPSRIVVNASNFSRGSNVISAIKLNDGTVSRIMTLMKDRTGSDMIHLEAPWSTSFKVEMPEHLKVYSPFLIATFQPAGRRREGSLKRIIGPTPSNLKGFCDATNAGRVDMTDLHSRRHRLQIQLQAREEKVRKVLEMCCLVLPENAGDSLRVAWWEVFRWLQRADHTMNKEWMALVVVLFCLAVPFITSSRKSKSSEQSRKKTRASWLSSAFGSNRATAWNQLMEQEIATSLTEPAWMAAPSWDWVIEEDERLQDTVVPRSTLRSKAIPLSKLPLFDHHNNFIVKCLDLAREFLQTPAGQNAGGPQGYLPTAASRPREIRQTALAKVLIGLHLLREEEKLDLRTDENFESRTSLSPIIGQIGAWLGWNDWSWKDDGYYSSEIWISNRWQFDDSKISGLEIPDQPFAPPSIFSFAEQSLEKGPPPKMWNLADIHSILTERMTKRQYKLREQAAKLTPRSFALSVLFPKFLQDSFGANRVEAVLDSGISADNLRTFPDGIAEPLYDSLLSYQSDPPKTWLDRLVDLIGRDDLLVESDDDVSHPQVSKIHAPPTHEALKDHHTAGNASLDTEVFHSFDASAEADRVTVTKLIFREDRRVQDAAKLVNQLRPPVAECSPEHDWSEADLLEAQKDLVQLVTMRTLAVSLGRAMMQYNARVPLVTEKVHIPAFSLQCLMRPMGVTLSADKALFTEDKVCWAFFHNGASTGLTISKAAKGIDTSWILYNKPPELTNRHAGFLLALGLNGHLKTLAKWVAFKYLTPKHTMTSIGLLLGLSASFLGTMDTLITRLLSVHVMRMLPPGAAELNLSPLTQTTGLMGIGLLYCASQHRRMSEVMLSELENVAPEISPSDVLRDEGYRLAAGFSLGFINLGKGSNLLGLRDMNVVERLLSLAIGTRNVNLVPILDRATAGATVAIALMFMKTDNLSIARKIDIPDTIHQFDYVRPDIFLLRTVARHLILWSNICPTHKFIRSSIPKAYRSKSTLRNIRHLSTQDLPFFNILAGTLLAVSLRYAGSGSKRLRDLLIVYLDQFIRLTRLSAPTYDTKLTRNAVRNCQDVTALAVSAVMAGSGDLEVFRRLRSLHGRLDVDTTYGSHLAAHMAIGALFLGAGTHTFGTGNVAVASLLCSFYPLFPTTVLDNKAHLQAFRHLWVLATEPRCLVTRDIDTKRPISIPVILTLKDDSQHIITSPSLIPDLTEVISLRTNSTDHWPITIDFLELKAKYSSNPVAIYSRVSSLLLRRRSAYDAPQMPPLLSALQAVDDAETAPSISTANSTTVVDTKGTNPFEWLWHLDTFKGLDVAEKRLVLPPFGTSSSMTAFGRDGRLGNAFLGHSAVDVRLGLEMGILSDGEKRVGKVSKDRFWQLRLLFAWMDHEDRERAEKMKGDAQSKQEQQHIWLRREVIESLRWRVWTMGAGG